MYNEKKYRCNDIFMVRTPALPFQIYLDLENKYEGNLDKLINDYNLYDFFKENLFIASKNLYGSFEKYTVRKESGKQKKIKNYKESILKYLIRSTIRPTPFAGFSKVGLGEFKNFNFNDELKINSNNIKNIGIDNLWFHNIIKIFENNENILYQLNIKINPICYKSGDRFKNPFYTNIAFPQKEEKVDFIKNNSIKYSPLIEFIEKERCNFISFSKLIQNISKKYPDVDLHTIKNTIVTLVKKEFLLTELRANLISKNPLKSLIGKLNKITLNKQQEEIFECLKKIDSLIESYNYSHNFNDIENAEYIMEKLYKSNIYFVANTGISFEDNILDIRIKKDLEEFIEIWKYFFVNRDVLFNNRSIAQEFQEYYGNNVEIPFVDFIDENNFDGINKLKYKDDKDNKISQREKFIKDLLDKKIAHCIANKEDSIVINKDEIVVEDMNLDNKNYPATFDMNFYITKKQNEDGYNYHLGPNVGSNEGGCSFQRFEEVFDKNSFKNYCSVYKEKEKISKDYIYAEIKEINNNGRIINILNKTSNYAKAIDFGMISDNTVESINIKDIYIGIDDNNLFYLKYKNKKIKFVLDSMLNPNLLNDVAYVLYKISNSYNTNLLNRIFSLNDLNPYFIPKIIVGNVTIFPKTWFLYESDFSMNNFEAFKNDINKYINQFNIEKILYLKDNDNRIIIDLSKDIYQKILFSELTKNKVVALSELENELFSGSLIKDEYDNGYISEFIFTFIKNNNSNELKSKNLNPVKLNNNNRVFNLLEDGWIYLKIYGVYSREKDLFSSLLNNIHSILDKSIFFFIRYQDNKGFHIRLRFKFKNSYIASKNILLITNWILDLKNNRIIGDVIYDTYRRETYRYGGSKLIKKAEECFDADSKFVISLLNNYDFSNIDILDKYLFIGIISILKIFIPNINELKDLLCTCEPNLSIKKEFHKKSSKYTRIIEEIYSDNNLFESNMEIKTYFYNRNNAFKEFKQLLIKENIVDNKNIILSFSHMFCNRLYGDTDYENRIMCIIYLSINRYINDNIFK